ncbi:hypothetical protein MMC16_004320 [Acarospora aff. strigata]|nr:hypothetical protein [Acarospora aff. strigata]
MAGQTTKVSQGPPYPPANAGLGLQPSINLDVPISAVFMFMFILLAATHMTILQLNRRRGHKFLLSGLMFGFCMARIVTCIMRIVWAVNITNVRVAIAAQVFVAAGVVLLFIINLIFAQRILRATHPHFGWHKLFSLAFKIIYATIVISLVMLITCTVQSFYTLNNNTRRIDRDVQIYGQVLFAFVAFLPIPLVLGSLLVPRRTRVEKFGSGRFRTKIAVLLAAAVLLCLGASFRVGTNIKAPRPKNNPAWYHSKACFYIFNLTIELVVVAMYAMVRVDKRFHVPDGSHGPGDYSRSQRDMEKEETFNDAVGPRNGAGMA